MSFHNKAVVFWGVMGCAYHIQKSCSIFFSHWAFIDFVVCVLLEFKLLFEFPAKLDGKNDEVDVRGSITDVFIGWAGSREEEEGSK